MSTNQQQASSPSGIRPTSSSHSPESSADAADTQVAQREKRANPRYPADCAVLASVHAGAVPLPGQMIDISLTGCRVQLAGQLSGIMTRVELQFELRGIGFRINGVTVGSRTKRGLAIRFLEMSERRRESLVEVLTELAREVEVKARQAEAAKGKSKPSSGQAPHLPAQSTATPANPFAPMPVQTASVPAAGAGRSVEVNLDRPSDRRSSSRHNVDTRARLLLIRSNIPMDGAIQNLSQTGCRIRTDERFNLGIFVRLEIEFYLHGLPLRLAGVSQAVVDKFTVGIRFLDMSQRSREQLTMLIEEIEMSEAELNNAVS